MFCQHCGSEIKPSAVVCLVCGAAAPKTEQVTSSFRNSTNDEWLIAMLLCFFLGVFGAHNFYLKNTGTAIVQLILGLCSCFIISSIWALVDFCMILAGSFKKPNGEVLKQNLY